MFYLKIFIVLIYELLILLAIAFIAGFVFLIFFDRLESNGLRFLHQFLVWSAWGFYFIFSWKRFGQTLPMRAWKLRLSFEQKSYKFLILRYIKVTFFWIFFPLNFLAIFFLKDRFLHDFRTKNLITVVQNKTLNK
jgi:uncharacterized RDD family membrane protein YckC